MNRVGRNSITSPAALPHPLSLLVPHGRLSFSTGRRRSSRKSRTCLATVLPRSHTDLLAIRTEDFNTLEFLSRLRPVRYRHPRRLRMPPAIALNSWQHPLRNTKISRVVASDFMLDFGGEFLQGRHFVRKAVRQRPGPLPANAAVGSNLKHATKLLAARDVASTYNNVLHANGHSHLPGCEPPCWLHANFGLPLNWQRGHAAAGSPCCMLFPSPISQRTPTDNLSADDPSARARTSPTRHSEALTPHSSIAERPTVRSDPKCRATNGTIRSQSFPVSHPSSRLQRANWASGRREVSA